MHRTTCETPSSCFSFTTLLEQLLRTKNVIVSTPAYLGPVTSTYTVRDTEWQSLSISAFCCNGYARRSDCLQLYHSPILCSCCLLNRLLHVLKATSMVTLPWPIASRPSVLLVSLSACFSPDPRVDSDNAVSQMAWASRRRRDVASSQGPDCP